MMIKKSQIPRVMVFPTWGKLFAQVSSNLEKLHKYTTEQLKSKAVKRG